MTEKEQLIARVAELSAKLGRDADTTGTVAELKARIEELEVELDEDTGLVNGSGNDGHTQPLSLTPAATRSESAGNLVQIIPKVTLHLRLGNEPLLVVKDQPCFIDAEQARQVVEVEQLARYADE
ncbi:DNA-packaging protein FI [Aeromonas sp. ARM81]|uniref:DNA-packaging protein FI n=1 Tax=Aeromonas sp. ARM81 TaxID=1747384 RepID=UPI00090A35CF|nr:DNA-packaging protein FI [Aeromonas sp. ARM81]ALN97528.1 DNA packaging protein FI [Aeromonas phage phiARM81ld]RDD48678.1 hypothetical protein ASJ36_17975 [Aeromonas sp. ARM81]